MALYEGIRLFLYRELATTGRVPSAADAADSLGIPEEWVWDAAHVLVDRRLLVLDENDDIVLAHPFATRSFGFSVMGERTLWWGGCAWDSFAIPHLVDREPSVVVATTCPACGTAHAWNVDRNGPPTGSQVAHFLVPMAQVWDDVVYACENQRIFCSEACVDDWLAENDQKRGAVVDLATLWRLAEHWYDGRLDTPYQRREPSEATEYFASVGLTGAFWEAGRRSDG